MKRPLIFFIPVLMMFMFFSYCEKDDITTDDEETTEEVSDETIALNKWIYENMSAYYYWCDEMPDIDYTEESNSEEYFEKLLYSDDGWSWITDDYAALAAEYSGEPTTMGYYPSFYLLSDKVSVLMVVDYVYSNSPAEEAGLERGDIVLAIDNTQLDTSNYYDLYSGSSYSVQLATIEDNACSLTGESIDMTAAVVTTDPSIYHTIIEENDYKIGYLVYVEFVCGDDNEFLDTLDTIFQEFKDEGVTDLVVDLRYNPGGDGDAAIHLASAIAPLEVVSAEEVLVKLEYNDDLQAYFEVYKTYYSSYLEYNFSTDATNLDLDEVYFLTTSGTASASELVISGLAPYMDVVQIGEYTYGKYAGAWILPDDDEEWAIIPIVTKYANADGYTDFVDGLTPDIEIDDEQLCSYPFGDTSDPMLAQAIEEITGVTAKSTRKALPGVDISKKLIHYKEELKSNLFIPFEADSIKINNKLETL